MQSLFNLLLLLHFFNRQTIKITSRRMIQIDKRSGRRKRNIKKLLFIDIFISLFNNSVDIRNFGERFKKLLLIDFSFFLCLLNHLVVLFYEGTT